MRNRLRSNYRNAYTLVETLVASSVIMLAVGAASSLSLAIVTQEEMSERAVRAANYLENVATLYRLGLDESDILAIIPNDPVIEETNFTPLDRNANGFGTVPVMKINMKYKASSASTGNPTGTLNWTGGKKNKKRSQTIQVLRPY